MSSIDQEKTTGSATPQPDFYMEKGLHVFTEAYHLKRGYCCTNGCRHCPWNDSPTLPSQKK